MIRTLHALSLALLCSCLAVGCVGSDDPSEPANNVDDGDPSGGPQDACIDGDLDGFMRRGPRCPAGNDCNDADNLIKPGAAEICGDQKDNNCDGRQDDGCVRDCVDGDGDNYGQGRACLGIDCDDRVAAVHAGADEICGNTTDENCDGMAPACPTNCTDADNDGFGAAGSTDCPTAPIDCDDADAGIHPEAREFCDGADNNCDGAVDECALEGQVCADGTCQGGAEAHCENHDDCAGPFLRCDRSTEPNVCKQAEGGPCSSTSECLGGLACDGGVCSGDWCAVNGSSCVGETDFCDRDAGQCVECPHWEPDFTVQDAACPSSGVLGGAELCVAGGWCGEPYFVESAASFAGTQTTEDIYKVSMALAYCWMEVRPLGAEDICYTFWADEAIGRAITEAMVEDAYLDGHMDAVLYPEENAALKDAWGVGTFDRKEIDWKTDLQPGTTNEICLWYQPGGVFSGEKMVVDLCENFAP